MDRVFCYAKLSLLYSPLFRKPAPDFVAAACQQKSRQKQTWQDERACKISPALSGRRRKASVTLSSSLLTASALLLCSGGVKAHDSSTEPGIFDHGESAQADLSDQLKQERLPQERVRMASSRGGEWSSVTEWPLLAVHASLLPNGKVLAWDATPDDFDEDPHTASSYTTRVTGFGAFVGWQSAVRRWRQ